MSSNLYKLTIKNSRKYDKKILKLFKNEYINYFNKK